MARILTHKVAPVVHIVVNSGSSFTEWPKFIDNFELAKVSSSSSVALRRTVPEACVCAALLKVAKYKRAHTYHACIAP